MDYILSNKLYIFIGLGILTFLLLLLFFLRHRFLKLAVKTKTRYSFVFFMHFAKYLFFYSFLILCFMGIKFLDLPIEIKKFSNEAVLILFVLTISVLVFRFSDLFLNSILKGFGKDMASTTIIRNVVKVLIILVFVLVILTSLKVSLAPLAPLFATLGIGGLTLAFAVKDILSNFFSGFYVVASNQLNVNDFVELETGEKGTILDINWRITKIKLLNDRILLIPNSKFVESRIINHNLLTKEVGFAIPVSVHYDSDLDLVEKITLEVAREVLAEVACQTKDFQPLVRFNKFDTSGVNFSVVLKAEDFGSQFILTHEFIKKLHARYRKENIVIHLPILAINKTQVK